MKLLVLGATGFIGGAIAERALARGDELGVLVREPSRGEAWKARGAAPFLGDLGDPVSIAEAAEGADVVVNAAGLVSPRAAPRALRWTHVAGTENLVNACKHVGVGRLVHVSCTDATLGNVDRVHWDETRPLPGEPFGERARTLQLAEALATSAAGPDLEVVVLRGAWVWGPGDTSRLPGLCREGLSGGPRLVGDGRTYLATTYIDHLVDAVFAAAAREDVSGQVFQVVDPTFQHARDFFGALSEALGLSAPRSGPPFAVAWPVARLSGRGTGGLSPAEMLQRGRSTLFDFNAAIGKLGYDPQVDLDEGLRALAAWVESEGGPAAVAALEKPPPSAASVDAQVEAAGGD
jgi:nucleoside-diphosphate-sugar epimerase